MKPGDHPEFFRFPAPAGRSREGGIVLDRLGRFVHEGERIEHLAMERAFFRWLRRHPDDGRFILSNGYDWTYLDVEGFPFFVRTVRLVGTPPERAELLLCDGSEEPLRPETLELDEEGVLHCEIRRGERARFSQQAQTTLGEILSQEDDGTWVLTFGGKRHPAHRCVLFSSRSASESAVPRTKRG